MYVAFLVSLILIGKNISMNVEQSISLLDMMLRIRLIEEKIADLYSEQKMRCPVHLCIGQEAIPAGVCASLLKEDLVFGNHRSHGHYLAKGGGMKAMIAEIYGKATGCSKGNGGSMHLVDLSVNFMGSTPIVGSIIPVATGAALAARLQKQNIVTIVFLGRASTEEGVFFESLNFAALKKLPIVFVSEDNFFSVYTPLEDRQSELRDNLAVARSLGVNSSGGDGNDVRKVFEISKGAVDHARSGKGPYFLEFQTYRWREHCGPNFDNNIGYRTESEYHKWKERCPVENFKNELVDNGAMNESLWKKMNETLVKEIEEAFDYAETSPFPESNQVGANIYAENNQPINL